MKCSKERCSGHEKIIVWSSSLSLQSVFFRSRIVLLNSSRWSDTGEPSFILVWFFLHQQRFMGDLVIHWLYQSHNPAADLFSRYSLEPHMLETTELHYVHRCITPKDVLFPHLIALSIKPPCPLVLLVKLVALTEHVSSLANRWNSFSHQTP